MLTYRTNLPVMSSHNRRTFVITATFERLMSLITATGWLG